MDAERFIDLQRKAKSGTLKPGDIQELIAEVARLRVANALAHDQIERLRRTLGGA